MKKIAALTLIPLLALTLSACGSNNSKKSSSSSTSSNDSSISSTTSNSSSDTTSTSPVTLAKYQSIKLGSDFKGSKNDGDTIQSVTSKLGKPSSINKTEVKGKKMATYTWGKLDPSFKASNVTISFSDGHANSKGYATLSSDKIKPLDKEKVNSIKKGSSYEDVIKSLGNPNAASATGSGNLGTNNIVYLTDKNGSATSFVFVNNKLISKSTTKIPMTK